MRADTHADNFYEITLSVTPPLTSNPCRSDHETLARPCSTCKSAHKPEIEKRIREERSYLDISRWLDEVGDPISNVAISKHAKEHMAVIPRRGARPFSGDFLENVRDAAADGLASGDLAVSLKDGIAAQKALDARIAKEKDRDWQLKLALVLSGRVPLPMLVDPAVEAIEGEYRPLLTSGAD